MDTILDKDQSNHTHSSHKPWTTKEEELLREHMTHFPELTHREIAEMLTDELDRSVASISTRLSVIKGRKRSERKEQTKQEKVQEAEELVINAATSLLDSLSKEARRKVLTKYIQF